MGEGRFDGAAFAAFSTEMDQNIALTNDQASRIMARFLRECFGYRTAVVRFESMESAAEPWVNCVSQDFPELEKEDSLFLSDPFCGYILDNFSEQKFFVASDVCKDYAGGALLCAVESGDELFAGAFGYSDVWRQVLVVLFFKRGEDYSESERANFALLYDMLAAKCRMRDRFVEYETLRFMKNTLFDSGSIGTVIITDDFEIVDSNRIFESYYRHRLSGGSIDQFLRSLLNVYNATGGDEDGSGAASTLHMGNYTLTVRSEKKPVGPFHRARYYLVTMDDGSGAKAAGVPAPSAERRQDFAERFGLSQREMEMIDALATGLKYQQIADLLFISISTVRTHVKNIYKKLDINNQRALLYLYGNVQNG